jgi:hypothetical protein
VPAGPLWPRYRAEPADHGLPRLGRIVSQQHSRDQPVVHFRFSDTVTDSVPAKSCERVYASSCRSAIEVAHRLARGWDAMIGLTLWGLHERDQ